MGQTVAVLGGDLRQIALCSYLITQKKQVQVFGLPRDKVPAEALLCKDWRQAVGGADAVILPLPASPDGRRLHLPLGEGAEAPLMGDIFLGIPHHIPVVGGKCSLAVKAMAEETGVSLWDYFENEALQQKNALPTAEGAVAVLMREVPCTVSGLSVGVTGYGRVAKALCRLLCAMGARVTVAARKREALTAAAAVGCQTLHLTGDASLKALCWGQQVIFNTVPYWLFTEAVLKEMHRDTVIIDLASAPGGVDGAAADACGISVIWALSLPGKYAPQTAGEIIGETVLAHLEGKL